jgi:hypothetical protein
VQLKKPTILVVIPGVVRRVGGTEESTNPNDIIICKQRARVAVQKDAEMSTIICL